MHKDAPTSPAGTDSGLHKTWPQASAGKAAPPTGATVWYDGECGFCRRFVLAAQARTAGRVRYVAYQTATPATCPVPHSELAAALHAIDEDGRIYRGAAAALWALAQAPRPAWLYAWPFALYRRLPGLAPIAEAVYAWVAAHRPWLSRLARWHDRSAAAGDAHARTATWLLRGLGLVYILAFTSLAVQRSGLYGTRGIVPLAARLEALARSWGGADWLRLPTLLWWGAGDGTQIALLTAGTLAGLWLLSGAAGRRLALFIAWLCYVSFVSVGAPFLNFQWDHLLLEAGAAALLLPRRSGGRASASIVGVWLLRWLLFRLMWSSGLVKLTSGDATWRLLAALDFHFWTQPLPNPLSMGAHDLPAGIKRAATAATLALELALPWAMWLGRRGRYAFFTGTALLMMAIALTGNYGFFNILTVVLALALLDDRRLARWAPRPPWPHSAAHAGAGMPLAAPRPPLVPLPQPLRIAPAALLVLASLAPLAAAAGVPAPGLAHATYRLLAPLRITAGYGLFARMTTTRPELAFEVQKIDGTWTRIDLRYKPGPAHRPSLQVAPHMPRLDWQLWFAALGRPEQNPWVAKVADHLCQQTPEVLGLFATPAARALAAGPPPRAVRVLRERYRPAPSHRRQRGVWWDIGPAQTYLAARDCL